MLALSDEQVRRLEARAATQLAPRIVAHLRQRFAPYLGPSGMADGLDGIVLAGIERAKRYGLALDDDLRLFCEAMALLGRDFDTALPWAAAMLTDPRLSAWDKTELLHDHLVFGAA